MLKLNREEASELSDSASESTSRSRGSIAVSLDKLTPLQEEVALQFARKIRALSEEELESIKGYLQESRTGEQNWRRGSP